MTAPEAKGRHLSEEHRRKISEAKKGYRHTPEARAKMSDAQHGRPKTEGHKRKIAEALKGKTLLEESRQKISDAHRGRVAWNKGRTLTEEHRRNIGESLKGKCSGPNSANWRGGISFEPYCVKFNESFKERVREFFGRVCAECGGAENGERHHVHHVNYRKDSCCSEAVVPLFVPLCRSCHTKTNFDREYWESRFTALIAERYGGKCYLPKPEGSE